VRPARTTAGADPARRSILTATAIALLVSIVVLVAAILPAEYGVDPLGTGRLLGLLDLYNAGTAAAPPITPPSGGPLFPQAAGFRIDSRQLTVPSLGSLEFKYALPKGASMVYSWQASAPIDFDFHTEVEGRPNASDTSSAAKPLRAAGSIPRPTPAFTAGTGRI
jgi:hypothetical protein